MAKKVDDDFVERLFRYLTQHRVDGTVTPNNPKKARVICEMWNKQFSDSRTTSDVRAAIHRLRVRGEPIGTNGKGCCMCLTPQEYMGMNKHLKSRAVKIFAAYWGPVKAYEWRATPEASFDGDIVLAEFKKEALEIIKKNIQTDVKDSKKAPAPSLSEPEM